MAERVVVVDAGLEPRRRRARRHRARADRARLPTGRAGEARHPAVPRRTLPRQASRGPRRRTGGGPPRAPNGGRRAGRRTSRARPGGGQRRPRPVVVCTARARRAACELPALGELPVNLEAGRSNMWVEARGLVEAFGGIVDRDAVRPVDDRRELRRGEHSRHGKGCGSGLRSSSPTGPARRPSTAAAS